VRLSAVIGTWLLVLWGAASAHAIPMNFSVFYVGSVLDGAGTGSFSSDDATRQVTDFRFTFSNFTGTQVPEPAGLALIGLAVFCVALVRRRRKAQ
jgi:hypothetical protein